MLAMHLLQSSLVLVNTILVQLVLAQPHWAGRLTDRDKKALTALFWGHIKSMPLFQCSMIWRPSCTSRRSVSSAR